MQWTGRPPLLIRNCQRLEPEIGLSKAKQNIGTGITLRYQSNKNIKLCTLCKEFIRVNQTSIASSG